MKDLILSASSAVIVKKLEENLPQGVLLTGMVGVGLRTTAAHIGERHGELIIVQPQLLTKTSTVPQISVERVRELYEQTRTKSQSRRVIVIDDVDAMTIAAQHAFLKLLEEPNSATHFILTSHHPETLLPTITSRIQTYNISPIAQQETLVLLEAFPAIGEQKRAQLLFIASGLPAELYRLANDEQLFRVRAKGIGLVKQLLEGSPYQRTALIHKEKLDRKQAIGLLDDAISMLMRNPTPQTPARLNRLLRAHESLTGGGNIKLQLMAAML